MSEGGHEVDRGDYFGTKQNMEFKRERAEKEEKDSRQGQGRHGSGEKAPFLSFLLILGIPA